MSALAAVLERGRPAAVAPVEKMLRAAPHRGDEVAVHAHGRTAIGIVVDPVWPRAWLYHDTEGAAAVAGVLDDRASLARDLGLPPDADPARLLLAAWRRAGTAGLQRLRGAFSGAVIDGTTLVLLRDQFGNRPLYLHDGADALHAATEIKQVVAGSGAPYAPDHEHLEGVYGGGIDRSTAIRGVERVPRASVAVAQAGGSGVTLTRYWEPEGLVETAAVGHEEAVAEFRRLLTHATERCLSGSDVILLSGGLDSTAIAACSGGAPTQALSSVYPDLPRVDESVYTRLAAEQAGLSLHTFEPQAGGLDDVEYWVRAIDGPVERTMLAELGEAYRLSRAIGGRTVLDGQVAEFLLEVRNYLFDHLLAHGRLTAAGRLVHGHLADGGPWRPVARAAVRTLVPPPIARRSHKLSGGRARWRPPWSTVQPPIQPRLNATVGARHRWRSAQTLPLRGSAPGFEVDDVLAAHCGVEVRRPFADVDLWEFALSLPAEVKIPSARPKELLRRAMRGAVPDAVLDRRDKTLFDDQLLARPQYPRLRRLLDPADFRLATVDYAVLHARLATEDLDVAELQSARTLAQIHAFATGC